MTNRLPFLAIGTIAAATFASACGKGDPSGPTPVTQLEIVGGSGQFAPAGTVLVTKVSIKASSAAGPVSGATITAHTEAQDGGSVTPATTTTSATGVAEVTWTLGSKVGVQTLTFTSSNGISTNATATATTGGATVVFSTSDALQITVVGRAVSVKPTVRVADNFGNPVAGAQVTFEAFQATASVTGAVQLTNTDGLATVGSWTIGRDAGRYDLKATIGNGATAPFQATGVPAALVLVAGNGQTVNAGTAVPIVPVVRATRDDATPLPNVPVTFVVGTGGGQLQGSVTLTASDGTARPVRWILGTTPGANLITTLALGTDPVTFTATGVAATPASVTPGSATSLTGFVGNYLIPAPSVLVTDAQSKPVAGVPVTFTLTSGDGTLRGATQATDFQGRATLASIRMGASTTETIQAQVGSLGALNFTATGSTPPVSTMKIDVRYRSGAPTPGQRAAFDLAVGQWTTLLVAGGAPYLVHEVDPSCPSISGEIVDGLVIFADLVPIDGPGRVLGRSGPCILRDDGFLPAEGIMQFDTADLGTLEASGQLNSVILHEMGHVLGFGTIWNFITNAFLVGEGTGAAFFNGNAARSAFFGSLTSPTFPGTAVMVETGGGPGTAFSHWQESSFVNELMTGFLNPGINPLSSVTVDQFRDLGYTVNDARADSYSLQAFLSAAFAPALQIVEEPLPGPIFVINRVGTVVGRYPRR